MKIKGTNTGNNQIQELELDIMCVGSDLSWWKSYNDVRPSKSVLSIVLLSSFYQEEDVALKSPKTIVNKELGEVVLLKSSSKSDIKFSNSILSWFGYL